jgi:predicted metal-dependent peptidase
MTTVIKSEKTKKDRWGKKEFSNLEKRKILDKLITARVGLLIRHPFFGNMATRLELIDASDWCSTLATDGRKFYYNNSFVNELTIKELEFGVGHEILHVALDHLGRREIRDSMLSNIAADYAANQILKDERIGSIPKCIQIYQDDRYRGKSYEEIYDELYQNADKIDIDMLGELLDDHLDNNDNGIGPGKDGGDESNPNRPKISAEERKKIRDEIREAILSSAQSVGADKIPASIARMIKDFTEPKMNWRQLIRLSIQSKIKNDFSFSRPNRKSQQSGAILPGMIREQTIDIALGIDMSGSINDKQGKDFISEVKAIMEEFRDFKIDLWCFDTNIYNYKQFTSDNIEDIVDYQCQGGGGTDFDVNYSFMKENDILPTQFIMFTDGYPWNSWGDEDYCDTLFLIHGNDSIIPPFGQVAYYK